MWWVNTKKAKSVINLRLTVLRWQTYALACQLSAAAYHNKTGYKWHADMITADDGGKISRGATFSFAALCFLGTLTFPQASTVLYPHWLNWGSWVTLVEISISPQNKKPGSVLSVISTIHPALWFSSSHQIHSLWFPSQIGWVRRF